MKLQNRNTTRLKKAKHQQLVISLSCLILLFFSLGWMINISLNTDKISVSESSSKAAEAGVKSEGNKKDDKSKSDKTSKKENNNQTSSKDENESEKDDSSELLEYDDFEDAAFIGDSRTVGLEMNSDKPKASFYASIGLNVSSALTDSAIKLDNGNDGTVLQAMNQKKFGRIFVMFGINELGWPYPDVFQEKYEELINQIKEVQPDAKIYVQSILPVSYLATNTNSVFTNENINEFNESYVKKAAENTGSVYLDVASMFKDENGALPVEASTDGIHLIRDYCLEWMDYLAENT